MSIVRETLSVDELPGLSREAKDRLDALSSAEVEANAANDPDNPPAVDEELARGLFGRRVRRARETLGLSQSEFALRFQINPGRLQDWEQGRVTPDSAISAYLTLIEREPELVRRVLEAA